MKGGLSNEVVSDEGEINMGHIRKYVLKAAFTTGVFFSRGWSLKGGTTVLNFTLHVLSVWCLLFRDFITRNLPYLNKLANIVTKDSFVYA